MTSASPISTMSGAAYVEVSPRCYTTIGLHAFRYPSANLLGFLLGKRSRVRCVSVSTVVLALFSHRHRHDRSHRTPAPLSLPPSSSSTLTPSHHLSHMHPQDAASSRVEVRVSDAVPLFHTHTLAPMLELAALLTQTRCEENGLEIVGCYFASERLEKPGVSPPVSDTVKSVAKTIVENLKSSGKARGLGAGGALVLGVDGAKLGKYIFSFHLNN